RTSPTDGACRLESEAADVHLESVVQAGSPRQPGAPARVVRRRGGVPRYGHPDLPQLYAPAPPFRLLRPRAYPLVPRAHAIQPELRLAPGSRAFAAAPGVGPRTPGISRSAKVGWLLHAGRKQCRAR